MADQIAAPGPQTRIDPSVESRLAMAGRLARWVAAVYATASLAGVASDQIAAVLPSGPDFVRDLPLASALPLAFLALAALLAGDIHRVASGPSLRRLGSGAAMLVLSYGFYVVVVYAIEFPNLWPVDPDTVALPSLWVGLILVVLAASILASSSRIESRVISGQVGSLLIFSATAVIFLGYVYGDVSVGRLFRPPEITFQSALVALVSSVGIILMRPGSGILAAASSPGAGGRMLRRFGPAALLLPAGLLAVVESVPSTERVQALVYVSVGLGLFLLALLAVVVRVIDETKIDALTAAAEAERARLGLEQEAPLVRNLSEALHIVNLAEGSALDVATRFRPGRGSVAGDSSAVRSLPDGSVAAVLVDMTGHGAAPAVAAIRVRDLLVHSMALGKTPAESMSFAGWTAPGDVLASAIAAKVDPVSGAVSIASAGHPPAIFIGAHEAELVESTGPLLYLDPTAEYGEVRFELARGDVLVLISDGVADVQRVRDGLPEPRLLADMLLAEGGVAARTADLVIGFADAEPADDQSALVIRRVP